MKRIELQETEAGWIVQWYVDGQRINLEKGKTQKQMAALTHDLITVGRQPELWSKDPARFRITWVDLGRKAPAPTNPFKAGIPLDLSGGAIKSCTAELPFPAQRAGHYLVSCMTCKQSVTIPTTGHRVDPRCVKLACRKTA